MTKHFFKTLVIFTGMIILGLLGVFLANYFDRGNASTTATSNLAK